MLFDLFTFRTLSEHKELNYKKRESCFLSMRRLVTLLVAIQVAICVPATDI